LGTKTSYKRNSLGTGTRGKTNSMGTGNLRQKKNVRSRKPVIKETV
jgi:hypothetical protein